MESPRLWPAVRPQTALALAAVVLSVVAFAANEVQGVRNFHQVDSQVYRGAQPTSQGFQNLARLGVKTVIDLREPGSRSRQEEKVVTAAGMRYVSIPFKAFSAPTTEQVRKVLAILEDTTAGPVFVHCKRGADRTGTVCACYRMEHDHWQNDKALAEARSFGMSPFERGIQNYVRHYQASTDAGANR